MHTLLRAFGPEANMWKISTLWYITGYKCGHATEGYDHAHLPYTRHAMSRETPRLISSTISGCLTNKYTAEGSPPTRGPRGELWGGYFFIFFAGPAPAGSIYFPFSPRRPCCPPPSPPPKAAFTGGGAPTP